jgi:hypothetical protein
MKNIIIYFLLVIILFNCGEEDSKSGFTTYEDDLNFLKKYHKDLVILGTDDAAQIIIVPGYQARVMTSTSEGKKGKSFGWINYDLIKSGKIQQHINAYGGEDRFWLGPEGGQFGLYFPKDSSFNFNNWQVPAALDTEPFILKRIGPDSANFIRNLSISNYSGTSFDLKINRTIKLIDQANLVKLLGLKILPDGISFVGYESINSIKNTGNKAWTKDAGTLSVWILSMLNATPSGIIALPYKADSAESRGPVVTDDYFGKVPAERLIQKAGLILFKSDAQYRSKIGVSGRRAQPWIASYDSVDHILTLAQFSLGTSDGEYVNSKWGIQTDPFGGDAVNAYNDGPNETGNQLGKFYELESSSPAAFLEPGDSLVHIHRTFHFTGSKGGIEMLFKGATDRSISELKF